MLQVARLSPNLLGESSGLVAQFLRDSMNPDGGFRDRDGQSDLYYTVFGLEGLIALREALPTEQTRLWLASFGEGEGLDFVHLCSLARCWACLEGGFAPASVPREAIAGRIEAYRTPEGGYNPAPDSTNGTAYGAFLAFGAYQDLGLSPPEPQRLLDSLQGLRARDDAYSNLPGMNQGVTTATAAAVSLLRALDQPMPRELGDWLLQRCHVEGGFYAMPGAPMPDLLSTATALHALQSLHVPLAPIQEACLDFVDSLWTNKGGFHGHWADDALDCEYTYYGLLALGHLSL